jgi:hypothetical protein
MKLASNQEAAQTGPVSTSIQPVLLDHVGEWGYQVETWAIVLPYLHRFKLLTDPFLLPMSLFCHFSLMF